MSALRVCPLQRFAQVDVVSVCVQQWWHWSLLIFFFIFPSRAFICYVLAGILHDGLGQGHFGQVFLPSNAS